MATSPYLVRTSYTLWQVTVPIAQHAAKKGFKKVVTAVSDYAPGIDAENAFVRIDLSVVYNESSVLGKAQAKVRL